MALPSKSSGCIRPYLVFLCTTAISILQQLFATHWTNRTFGGAPIFKLVSCTYKLNFFARQLCNSRFSSCALSGNRVLQNWLGYAIESLSIELKDAFCSSSSKEVL